MKGQERKQDFEKRGFVCDWHVNAEGFLEGRTVTDYMREYVGV